jgi:hypothetical protein
LSVGDASDNIMRSDTTIQIVEPDGVTVRDTFTNSTPVRTTQQAILPTAIQGRFQAPLIYQGMFTTAPIVVEDGRSLVVTTGTENTQHQTIEQFVAWQVYLNSIDVENRMPESFSSSSYPFYTWSSLYDVDGQFRGEQPWWAVNKIQVRNNSGATQTFYVQNSVKLIANRSSTATTGF